MNSICIFIFRANIDKYKLWLIFRGAKLIGTIIHY